MPCLHRRAAVALLAASAGIAFLPSLARGDAPADALLLTCIECRSAAMRLAGRLAANGPLLATAGGSHAAVSAAMSGKEFWEHPLIAGTLAHVGRLIVIDHRGCAAFGSGLARHRSAMGALAAALEDVKAGLKTEFYLMALDGKAEKIAV